MTPVTHHSVSIQPVIGGFVVQYPVIGDDGVAQYVQEAVTTVGKAMRVAKAKVEEFSLVKKAADDAEA